jgi:hypothetical protein
MYFFGIVKESTAQTYYEESAGKRVLEIIKRHSPKEKNESSSDKYGRFIGELTLKAIGTHRKFQLIQPFSFIDVSKKMWSVPEGAIVDGASIPQAFCGVIGGPWEGKYAKSSVIHDYYCEIKTEDWKDVHRAFYYGMLANDAEIFRAKIMYWAVYRFGPRWELKESIVKNECVEEIDKNCQKWKTTKEYIIINKTSPSLFNWAMVQNEIENMTYRIVETDLSLDEIDKLSEDNISRVKYMIR